MLAERGAYSITRGLALASLRSRGKEGKRERVRRI